MAIKVSVLTAFIIVGGIILMQNYDAFAPNWQPFIPEPTGERVNSAGAASCAPSIVFFAYIGFEGGLDRRPGGEESAKDMPFGIIGSLVVCTVIYILVSIVLTMIVPYTELNVPDRSRSRSTPSARSGAGWPRPSRSVRSSA